MLQVHIKCVTIILSMILLKQSKRFFDNFKIDIKALEYKKYKYFCELNRVEAKSLI